jgi:ubiquinone/menaquinone biosynthesis C-methylase UbiE
VGVRHADVGVGTGYFLDRCRFPSATPNITLIDLNRECLATTARRIRRFKPTTYEANVLAPLNLGDARFDSIALN